MRGELFVFSLLALVFLNILVIPVNSLEVEALLVGYGGERMLPFVDGATLTYFVGESLELKSIGSSIDIELIDPMNRKLSYRLYEGETSKIFTFGEKDVGVWLLRHNKLGTMFIRVVDDYSPEGAFIHVQKLNDEAVRLSLRGPAFMGFVTNDVANAKIINAPSILPITIPQGTSYARITLEYNETIELNGLIGSVQYRYKTDSIITEYIYRFDKPLTSSMDINLEIPRIGEVGRGGIVPLRVGSIKLKVVCSGPNISSFSKVEELLVVPKLVNLPSMSRTIEATLYDLLNKSLKIAYFNTSSNTVNLKYVEIPVYGLAIFDKTLSSYVDDYFLNVNGMITIRTGHRTYLIPSILPVLDSLDRNEILVNPRLRVYSVDFTNAVKNLTLKNRDITTIAIESREVRIIVRYADGTLINDAQLFVNSSAYKVINGSTRVRMPVSTYNFSAVTESGYTSLIANISETADIQLVIRALLPITIAMILVSSFQGALLVHLLIRLLKLKRTLKIN